MDMQVKGFTVVELIITIAIIGILNLLTLTVSSSVRPEANDRERADDISNIARRLEQIYVAQELGAPSYPSTVELLTGITNSTGVGAYVESAIFKAPGKTTSSVVVATSTSTTIPNGGSGPTIDQYVYQPLKADGSLCTSPNSALTVAENCVRFIMYHRSEVKDLVVKNVSFYQQ